MVTLTDGAGTAARLDDRGRLVELQSRGQSWSLSSPGGGWSAALTMDGVAREAAAAGAPAEVAAEGDRVRLVFDGLALDDDSPLPGRAVVRWWLTDGLLQGTVELSGWPESVKLVELSLPDVTVGWSNATATSLTVPIGMGYVLHEAAVHLFAQSDGVTFRPPEFQCYGWAEGERGLYLDTRDPEGWVKHWRLRRAGEQAVRIQSSCTAPAELDPAVGFALPYAASLAGYDGHWYDLGRVYRRWALGQVWAQRGPGERRDSYFAEVACWLWNRGPAAGVVPPAKELARRLGAPVALDWYWWHKHGYDTEYPDYFPPREGEATFRAAVAELQAADVRVQVYTNGMTVDLDGGLWPQLGPPAALLQKDGDWHAVAFNRFTQHRLAFTCGAAPAWHETVSRFVAQARALGLDGLYLDMIGNAGGNHACYSTEHDHAPGGGSYGRQGFRALFERLRAEHPGFALSTEGTQEQYLDLVEGNIVVDASAERWNWHRRAGCPSEGVPLFSSIYHGRCVGFGNYAFLDGIPPFDDLWPQEYRLDPAAEPDWHARCPDQFALEAARTVAFGLQPMVCNLTAEHLADPRLAADVDFLLALARFHHTHREHLLWGEMLPPGDLRCARPETAFLQRYIFTKPGQERIESVPQPAILHSAWTAPDGTSLLVLINHRREPADFEYRAAAGWRLSDAPPGATLGDDGVLRGTLPPRSLAAPALVAAGG